MLIKDISIYELHARLTGRAGISTKTQLCCVFVEYNSLLLISMLKYNNDKGLRENPELENHLYLSAARL